MPFHSKAQIRKFARLEKQGKLPKGTLKKWLSETPNVSKLPERIGKKKGRMAKRVTKAMEKAQYHGKTKTK